MHEYFKVEYTILDEGGKFFNVDFDTIDDFYIWYKERENEGTILFIDKLEECCDWFAIISIDIMRIMQTRKAVFK